MADARDLRAHLGDFDGLPQVITLLRIGRKPKRRMGFLFASAVVAGGALWD